MFYSSKSTSNDRKLKHEVERSILDDEEYAQNLCGQVFNESKTKNWALKNFIQTSESNCKFPTSNPTLDTISLFYLSGNNLATNNDSNISCINTTMKNAFDYFTIGNYTLEQFFQVQRYEKLFFDYMMKKGIDVNCNGKTIHNFSGCFEIELKKKLLEVELKQFPVVSILKNDNETEEIDLSDYQNVYDGYFKSKLNGKLNNTEGLKYFFEKIENEIAMILQNQSDSSNRIDLEWILNITNKKNSSWFHVLENLGIKNLKNLPICALGIENSNDCRLLCKKKFFNRKRCTINDLTDG